MRINNSADPRSSTFSDEGGSAEEDDVSKVFEKKNTSLSRLKHRLAFRSHHHHPLSQLLNSFSFSSAAAGLVAPFLARLIHSFVSQCAKYEARITTHSLLLNFIHSLCSLGRRGETVLRTLLLRWSGGVFHGGRRRQQRLCFVDSFLC